MGKSDKKRKVTDITADPVVVASEPAILPPGSAMDIEGTPIKKVKKEKDIKKVKKEKDEETDQEIDPDAISPIAHPLASRKLGKKVLKNVKRASKQRFIKRGVKEVVKSLRKGEKGLVIMAADISPMDVLTHIPLLAEESGCGYLFVTSKEALGAASSTKRPTSCVMITPNSGGSAAAQKKMEERRQALVTSDPEKAKKNAEELEEYKEAYATVLKEVMDLDQSNSY